MLIVNFLYKPFQIKRIMKNLYLLLCLLPALSALGQAPVSETIHVNSIEAKVWSNGAFFGYNNERSFKIPVSEEEDSVKVAVFRSVVPWMGGYDDFGNLKIACASPTGITTDFLPGIMWHNEFNQIWRVTKEQIIGHIQDWQDNGIIDNPIPAIINWPGMLMLHSYPSDTTFVNTKVAPFYDSNFNNVYEPLLGDFPHPDILGVQGVIRIPDEMLFFAFHDYTDSTHPYSHSKKMGMQIFCTVWAYSCPEDDFFNNSIFVNWECWNRMQDPIDSLHIGFLMNIELGNSNDNFIGSIPEQHIFYTYNGDSIDENGFEENTPLVSVFTFNAYAGTEPNIDIAMEYFMPINSGNNVPAGSGYPQSPQGFYNYLTGHWSNGTPLREGGNGFHPNENLPAVRCVYPDNPTVTTGWSEPAAGNNPGQRMALVSVPTSRMNPNTRTFRTFCYSWLRQNDALNPLSTAIDVIQQKSNYLSDLWTSWDSGLEYPDCFVASSAPSVFQNEEEIKIWPNPSTSILQVSSPDLIMKKIVLLDVSGKTCYEQSNANNSQYILHLSLPPGLYFLTIDLENNTRIVRKIIITP